MKHTDEILSWYLNSVKANKETPDVMQALCDLAQLVAWRDFGEPSGYSHRLLTPEHALRNARAAIGIPLPETEEDEPCNA